MIAALRRHRPNHGTVVAYLAVFLALGGTSYAVATNSVGSSQIRDNSIRSQDIRTGAVSSSDIKKGAAGIRGLAMVQAESPESSQTGKSKRATCPAGKRALGGGASIDGNYLSGTGPDSVSDVAITQVQPSPASATPGYVDVIAYEVNPTSKTWFVKAYVVCASAS